MSASFVRSVNSLMTGAPFSDRGVQHIPCPSQRPDSEPGVRWLTRAVHRWALEARDVKEHRNTGLHGLASSEPLTRTFVVALCARSSRDLAVADGGPLYRRRTIPAAPHPRGARSL